MEIKVNKIDDANTSVEAKISDESLNKEKEKIAKKMAKNIKLDGFRKGKVPVSIVKSRFNDQIMEEAQGNLLREVINDALKELDKSFDNLISEPAITKFDTKDGFIDVELKFFFKPIIDTEGYKELVPSYDEPVVSEEEVDERIEKMLRSIAKMKTVEDKDRTLQNGDFALIDFEGLLNNEPFEGGKATKYLLEIGSKQFIEGFEEKLIGLKANEEREIELTFPEDYNSKELAGKDVVFKVFLHEIKSLDIPKELDEDTLKKLIPGEKKPTVEKLKERVKEQIAHEKQRKIFNEELKPKYTEALIEKFDFALPESIVEKEIDISVEQKLRTMSKEELDELKDDTKKYEALRDEFREDAINSVKLTFLIDELSRLENITVSDQEVAQTVYLEAIQTGQEPKKVLEYYEKQGYLPAIKMSLIEDRLFTHLFTQNNQEEEQK